MIMDMNRAQKSTCRPTTNGQEDLICQGKGLFTYYVSQKRGKGVRQMLTIADKGGKGGQLDCSQSLF